VAVQSITEIDLFEIEAEKSGASLAKMAKDPELPSQVLATYTFHEKNVTKMNIYFRCLENSKPGNITCFIIPLNPQIACQVVQIPIKPLCFYEKISEVNIFGFFHCIELFFN